MTAVASGANLLLMEPGEWRIGSVHGIVESARRLLKLVSTVAAL